MRKASEDPQRSKRNLLDDSDSESDGGAPVAAPALKVNQEFARRFEHNKQREEKQRLEEKFKGGKAPAGGDDDDDDDSSSDESEDEDGFLATEDLDAQISATLQAIRNKDPKVYDKEVTFYKNSDEPTTTTSKDKDKDKDKKDKPVYLRDYHREKLLAGDVGASDDEDDAPQTYYQEQDALKKSIISEINAVAADDDEEDDGFLKRKPQAKLDSSGVHPSRKATLKVTELDVMNADKNPENFLSNFMSARAWVPPDGSNWKAFESDEGEGDDRADEFEQAYNLRFEDPDKSNEVLRTYARDLAAEKSARREEKTGRKRQRELEREQKEEAKQKRRDEKARLRKLKLDEAEAKLRKIKHAVGSAGKEFNDEDWIKFLDDAWENDKWEEEMRKRFGDEYYAQTDDIPVSDVDESDAEGSKKKKRAKKPKWEDDIDIKDIIPDFEDEEKPKISLSDVEGDDAEEGQNEEGEDEDAPPSKKRKTADHKRTHQEAQKKAREERSKLEALVDSKLELTNHALLNNPNHTPFRYRETSPNSFGMTARDILLAPSDQVLNEFAGLKKFATFRDEEKKRRDRKTLGKKHRLRQWRRGIFGSEYERTGPTYGFERVMDEEDLAKGSVLETKEKKGESSNIVGEVGETRKKKRKRSKGKKGAATAAAATVEAEAGADE
ncbi:Kinetochore protein Spc24 [Neonectria magnoliae]|uniref:Kinetochore protein Spc24 n=1 Tax=Neonectria magnoliae TaxID=2732573 RepID=A0ABR1HWN6_9HYPO